MDQITLLNIDKNNQEISGGIVDAGTRIIVVRRPPDAALKQ